MRSRPLCFAICLAVCSALVVSACTGEDATPIDQFDPTSTTAPGVGAEGADGDLDHELQEPGEEMRRLAEQQCLDDPTLSVGEITAVDPDDSSQVLLSVTVDCADVR